MLEVCCQLNNCRWNVGGSCVSEYIGINSEGWVECFETRSESEAECPGCRLPKAACICLPVEEYEI